MCIRDRIYPVSTDGLDIAPMHQRGILRWRVRVRPRTQTRMGMRKALPHMLQGDFNKHLSENFPDKKPNIIVHCWGDWFQHSEDLHWHTHAEHSCLRYEQVTTRFYDTSTHQSGAAMGEGPHHRPCLVHLRERRTQVTCRRQNNAGRIPSRRLQQQRPVPHESGAATVLELRLVQAKSRHGHMYVFSES